MGELVWIPDDDEKGVFQILKPGSYWVTGFIYW